MSKNNESNCTCKFCVCKVEKCEVNGRESNRICYAACKKCKEYWNNNENGELCGECFCPKCGIEYFIIVTTAHPDKAWVRIDESIKNECINKHKNECT
jgi:hypothetical protein